MFAAALSNELSARIFLDTQRDKWCQLCGERLRRDVEWDVRNDDLMRTRTSGVGLTYRGRDVNRRRGQQRSPALIARTFFASGIRTTMRRTLKLFERASFDSRRVRLAIGSCGRGSSPRYAPRSRSASQKWA